MEVQLGCHDPEIATEYQKYCIGTTTSLTPIDTFHSIDILHTFSLNVNIVVSINENHSGPCFE